MKIFTHELLAGFGLKAGVTFIYFQILLHYEQISHNAKPNHK